MSSGSLPAALETEATRERTGKERISVCHVASGDLWAGAEAQIASLFTGLSCNAAIRLFAILLNEGRLSDQARKCGVEWKVIPESQNSFLEILQKATVTMRSRQIRVLHSHRYKENLLTA